MDFGKATKNLELNGFTVRVFETAEDAKKAVCSELKGQKIALGGSVTLQQMGMFDELSKNNEVYWHWVEKSPEQHKIELNSRTYITSANAVSESGEIVNIDGSCNRVTNSMYDKDRVYFIVGANKLAPSLELAVYRARNFAAPKNAARLKADTPCAVDGKCHDCKSPSRICRALTVLLAKPSSVKECHVIFVNQPIGY